MGAVTWGAFQQGGEWYMGLHGICPWAAWLHGVLVTWEDQPQSWEGCMVHGTPRMQRCHAGMG